MRLQLALLAAAAALAGGAAHAQTVDIRDAVARVTVIPENRNGVKVEVVSANNRIPLDVRTSGDRTVIDGQLDRRIRNCRGDGERSSIEVRGVGDIAWRDMPQIVIRTPRNTRIYAGGAVFGSVGRSTSLTLNNAGCGDWTVANVEGELRLRQAGSGDTRAGNAGSAHINIAGSGDLAAADIKGALEVDIAGSGDVMVKSVNGPLEVSIAGSGDVTVAGGRASSMSVSIAGSGDVNFGGSTQTLKARIAGSGDVKAREVKGEISKSVIGSGSIIIG